MGVSLKEFFFISCSDEPGARLGRPQTNIVNFMDMRRQQNISIMLGTFPRESPEAVADRFGNLIHYISACSAFEVSNFPCFFLTNIFFPAQTDDVVS